MYGLSDSCNFLDALVLVYLFMKWKGYNSISLSHAFLVIWWVKYSLNWGVEIYITILEREIFFPDGSCTIGIIVVNAEHKYNPRPILDNIPVEMANQNVIVGVQGNDGNIEVVRKVHKQYVLYEQN